MCEVKAGGKIQVPDWMHKLWLNCDKGKLAKEFESVDFNKDGGFECLLLCSGVYTLCSLKCIEGCSTKSVSQLKLERTIYRIPFP